MTDKPTQVTQDAAPARERKRRSLLSRLARLVIYLALIAAIALVAVKFYVAPMVIADQVEKSLGEYCLGPVKVGGVEFNYFGPIRAYGLVLRNQAGDKWMDADLVTVELEDWPGLRPRVTKLTFRRPNVTIYQGEPSPFTSPADPEPMDLFDLRDVLVDGATLTLVRPDGQRESLESVRISGSLREGEWLIDGKFGESESAHILTGRAQKHAREDGSTVTEFTGLVTLPSGKASITADVASPADPARKLTASLEVIADTFGGAANCQVDAVVPADGSPRINIKLVAGQMDLEAMSAAWRFDEPLDGRLVSLQVSASLTSAGLEGATANGLVVLDDVLVRPDSILDTILLAISPDSIAHDHADVQAVFSLDGPVVTIHSGSVGYELIALDIEPGSTINLDTRELNGEVVVVVMKEVSHLLGMLPMMSILADMGDDLTRSRVTGPWDAPEVLPIPMGRLAGRTVQMIRGFGSPGGLMFAPMQGIFNALPPIIPPNGD